MSTPPEKNVEKKVPPGPGDEDGSFNTLTGAARITSKDARQVLPGLYRMNIKDPGESMVWRFFLLFDRKQQRMEQHSKRKCGKLKKPEELNPFEWTLVSHHALLPPAGGKDAGNGPGGVAPPRQWCRRVRRFGICRGKESDCKTFLERRLQYSQRFEEHHL